MSTSISIPPRRYSLPAFFLLAFGISWIVWVPAAAASWDVLPLELSPALSGLFGAFGPSLAAIILTLAGEGAPGLLTASGATERSRGVAYIATALLIAAVAILIGVFLAD